MCGYTRHFLFTVANEPFYRGKLPRCVWPDLPEIHLPWEISMVTSKRAKKPPMTLNLVKSCGFRYPSKTTIRFLQHETAKFAFLNSFLSHLLREISMVTWQISWQNFELVCWNKFRNDISQKYVLFLVSNSGMQLNCKIELCTFAKLSWITYQLKFQL